MADVQRPHSTPEVFYMTLGEPDLELELIRKANYDSLSDELRATQADAAMDRENARAALHRAQCLEEQLEAALDALDKGRRFERFYQESLGATPTATQFEILDNLQSAFLDAYLPLLSNPAREQL